MPLDPEVLADCPYGPGGVLVDEVLEVDVEGRRLSARMPVSAELPLTSAQRVHPQLHPPHVAAGLMVHVTGILGYLHLYYIEGLRHRDGWSGFGVRIHGARFTRVAHLDAPLHLEVECRGVRRMGDKMFSRYAYRFSQDGLPFYQSEQSAVWTRVQLGASAPVV